MENSKFKMVYVITERAGKNYWNRIGVAFVNHDGSINVKLDAMPVKGELQIRDYVPRDEFGETQDRSGDNGSNGRAFDRAAGM